MSCHLLQTSGWPTSQKMLKECCIYHVLNYAFRSYVHFLMSSIYYSRIVTDIAEPTYSLFHISMNDV